MNESMIEILKSINFIETENCIAYQKRRKDLLKPNRNKTFQAEIN
jgi:hypothetical protein